MQLEGPFALTGFEIGQIVLGDVYALGGGEFGLRPSAKLTQDSYGIFTACQLLDDFNRQKQSLILLRPRDQFCSPDVLSSFVRQSLEALVLSAGYDCDLAGRRLPEFDLHHSPRS